MSLIPVKPLPPPVPPAACSLELSEPQTKRPRIAEPPCGTFVTDAEVPQHVDSAAATPAVEPTSWGAFFQFQFQADSNREKAAFCRQKKLSIAANLAAPAAACPAFVPPRSFCAPLLPTPPTPPTAPAALPLQIVAAQSDCGSDLPPGLLEEWLTEIIEANSGVSTADGPVTLAPPEAPRDGVSCDLASALIDPTNSRAAPVDEGMAPCARALPPTTVSAIPPDESIESMLTDVLDDLWTPSAPYSPPRRSRSCRVSRSVPYLSASCSSSASSCAASSSLPGFPGFPGFPSVPSCSGPASAACSTLFPRSGPSRLESPGMADAERHQPSSSRSSSFAPPPKSARTSVGGPGRDGSRHANAARASLLPPPLPSARKFASDISSLLNGR